MNINEKNCIDNSINKTATNLGSSMVKVHQSMLNLESAIARLKEAIVVPQDSPLAIDGTIQRFEFAFELYWKTLKKFLSTEGIDVNTPREVLRQAFAAHWLDDEDVWLSMLQDRNETTHIYDEQRAQKIYINIKKSFPIMEKTFFKLKERIKVE